MGGRDQCGDEVVERTDGGVMHRERERRAGDRPSAAVHEQPAIERHELPGAIPVGAYHEYYHAGRWEATHQPLTDGAIDWLGSDEWLAYDVDVHEPGPYDLSLWVAGADDFGGGDVGIVVDDEPRQRLQFDATGGWSEWNQLTTGIELPGGLHTIRLVVFDGGWKLRELQFR